MYVGASPLGYVDPLGLQRRGEIDSKEAEALNTPDTNSEIQRLDREEAEAARARNTTPYIPPRPASEYGESGQCSAAPPTTARVGPIDGNGGSPDFLTPGEIARIQNAANRIGRPINLVGSRATGTSGPGSDWDYVIDANAPSRNSVSRSLPGAGNLSEGIRPNLDVFNGQLDPGAPYVRFTPEPKQ